MKGDESQITGGGAIGAFHKTPGHARSPQPDFIRRFRRLPQMGKTGLGETAFICELPTGDRLSEGTRI